MLFFLYCGGQNLVVLLQRLCVNVDMSPIPISASFWASNQC